jgi:hypothetical protein
MDEFRDVATQVEQGVELDGTLGTAEFRPWEQGKAQVYGTGIQRVDRVVQFDAEVVVGIQASRLGDQHLGEFGIDAPVPVFVGVGQGGPRHLAPDTGMEELRFQHMQAGNYIS